MKILKINRDRIIYIDSCDVEIGSDKTPCPAFASCCEYGDICQIEHKENFMRENGFPVWCPLEDPLEHENMFPTNE